MDPEDSAANPKSDANVETKVLTAQDTKEEPKLRFAKLYREDVVESSSAPGVLGLVTKVAGDADSDDSEDEDEEEEPDESEALAPGHARIYWANSEESTQNIDEIKLIDRSFLYGDFVARISSPLGQLGTVIGMNLHVDLQLPNGEIVKDIDSKKIRRIHPFAVGDYVIQGHWLGRVEDIYENVTVMFDDGSRCKVCRAESDRLLPVSVSPMDDSESPYYPGQRVRASFSGLFKSARWIKGCWKSNRMEGTVVDVEVNSVIVNWITAAHVGGDLDASGVPAEKQSPKNLKILFNFSHTAWQLGDRALLDTSISNNESIKGSYPSEGNDQSDVESGPVESSQPPQELESSAQEQGLESSESGKPASTGVKDSANDSWAVYRRKLKRRFTKHKKKSAKKDDAYESALQIVGTKTRVDVQWQDGTRELGVDSCSLFPVDHLGEHDFFPEQHVMERSSDLEETDAIDASRRVGVVKSMDAKERTAIVRWLAPTLHPQKLPCFENEETISAYELVEHPDFDYCIGDAVIRLSSNPASHEARAPKNIPLKKEETSLAVSSLEEGGEEEENRRELTTVEGKQTERVEHAEDDKKQSDEHVVIEENHSWVGVITDLEDGQVEVTWADGMVTKVGPQAIFVVGRDEDDASTDAESAAEIGDELDDDDDDDDAASWTTVDSAEVENLEGQDNVIHTEPEQNEQEGSDQLQLDERAETTESDGCGTLYGLGSTLSLPFCALIAVLKFAMSFLWALRGSRRASEAVSASITSTTPIDDAQDDGKIVDEHCKSENMEGEIESSAITSVLGADNNPVLSNEDNSIGPDEDGEETIDNDDAFYNKPKTGEACNFFKSFDSVKDSEDHNFHKESYQSSNQRRWSKKIQQEWAMLERSLPDTIFVRVYEDRMDLLRAVIVGASGTPYHDGLFFFDIHLPADYPTVPPLVHYHSGGLRLNPNLYDTGKVCLSLLNTWTGKGSEIWHPSTSSILQVLVSIQGLVLNANPYFNEAGYGKQIGTVEGEKNSLAYAENSFLLSCKSMLYLIRRPPKHFEEFVREHFKRRGPHILKACVAYMHGSPVGCLFKNGTISPPAGKESEQSTAGFRLMLAKIIPRLVLAFNELGADCQGYEEYSST